MRVLVLLSQIAFGALFIWSGVAKIKDPIAFTDAVRNFAIVGDPIAPALALFIPWVEVTAGIGIVWDRFWKGSAAILLLSLVVFTGAIVSAWVRGLDISCGCFGGTGELNYPVKVAQNCGLMAWGVMVWWGKATFGLSPSERL